MVQQYTKVDAPPGAPVRCQCEQRLRPTPLACLLVCADHLTPCALACMKDDGVSSHLELTLSCTACHAQTGLFKNLLLPLSSTASYGMANPHYHLLGLYMIFLLIHTYRAPRIQWRPSSLC